MKRTLTILGIMLSLHSFTQQLYNPTLQFSNPPYSVNSADQIQQYDLWPNDENYISSIAAAEDDEVLWVEDFANGLTGNNSSSTQTWTVSGPHGDIWEHDTDGSNGIYSGDSEGNSYTLDSETKDDGWMIFDADKANGNIPQSAYQNKDGELISPIIDLSQDSNVTLKFTQAYRYCCSSQHKLKVYVFDGNNWNSGYDVNIGVSTNELKITETIELNITEDAALKSNVQIKFVWEPNTASTYYWMIDDVKIIKTKPYSVNLLNAFFVSPGVIYGGSTYRLMPLEQITESSYYFSGILRNTGYNAIDSTRVFAKIEGESYNGQSNGLTSQPTSVDTLYTNNGFTPANIGQYNINVFSSNDDTQFETDTIQLGFEVSQYEYGTDNGNYNQGNFGQYTVNDDGAYEIGNRFVIYKAKELETVKIRLDAETGNNAKGKIIINEVLSDGSFVFIGESQIEDIGQYAGQWYNFKFDTPHSLEANKEYLITLRCEAANSDDNTVFISTGGSVRSQTSFIHNIDGVGENIEPGTWFYLTQAACLRLNFEEFASVNENNNLKRFNVHPNPNKGIFSLDIQTKSKDNLHLNITNILGQNVYSESLFEVNSINKNINLSNLEKGIYLVNLVSPTGITSTQKVIIN